MIRAVVFDLYDTLLRIDDAEFQRCLPRLEGTSRRAWVDFMREVLVVEPFADRGAFVDAVLARLHPGSDAAHRAEVMALLDRELASVRLLPGVLSLLSFLRRRGYRLGLISNAASPYVEPLARLGLAELFDVTLFSCDERRKKPEPGLYLAACERLGVAPHEALMVGDSLANDFEAPRRVGMSALLIGDSRHAALGAVAELGWRVLEHMEGMTDGDVPRRLLGPGDAIELGGRQGVLRSLEPLGDDEQGRYNLVAAASVDFGNGALERVFCKRFLHPESAHVEAFAHRLLGELGIATYAVGVLDLAEPVFVSAEAPGRKMGEEPITPGYAFEVGRHFAAGYLISNADLRPRNAFVSGPADAPRITMVDHEHCLLNLAIDVSEVPGRFDPRHLAALGAAELRSRVARRVLSELMVRRARRAFFETRGAPREITEAFRAGWYEVHRRAQERVGVLRDLVRSRLAVEPWLVVGTQAYRRAMLELDLDDMLERIAGDPAVAVAPALDK